MKLFIKQKRKTKQDKIAEERPADLIWEYSSEFLRIGWLIETFIAREVY